ncbi:MAG TPA: serine O-acetyltransferase EpsC [Candidatus Binataceae bacterium]|nr:serine O-acetyltransferase EpsC [Candidatus Binataceae bacterium]
MSQKLAEIGDSLVESFCLFGGINHLDGANLPSREAVVGVTQDLLRLMFPGFYDKDPIPTNQIAAYASELVSSVARRLENEMRRSLEYRPHNQNGRDEHVDNSFEVTLKFLQALPEIRETLHTDVTAAYEGDPAATCTDEVILAYPGVEAIAVQRMAHLLYQQHVPLIPRIMTEWVHNKTGIDIHPGAQIGPHFFIDHGTGVVIGETTVIGSNVKIYQGVTLGAKSFPKDESGRIVKGIKRHPNIENDVTIYAGATILGNITVGRGSVIGGNVWLLDSIPPDSVVHQEGGLTKVRPLAKQGEITIGYVGGSGI